MSTTTAPTTPANQQDIAAALGGISQARYSLRHVKRLIGVSNGHDAAGFESLHDAIDALTVSVECLAQVVARSVRP